MATTHTKDKSTEFDTDELLALAKLDLSKENTESALAKIKAALKDSKAPDEAYSLAAKIYAQLGLYQRAQAMFKSYLDKNPGAPLETFQLGMTFFDAGERQEALGIWDAILKEQPTHPPALFYTALALAQQGETDPARKRLETLLKSAPTDNLYFGRGKELLEAMQRGGQTKASDARDGNAANNYLLHNAYGTEH